MMSVYVNGDLNHHFYKEFGGPIALDTVGTVDNVVVDDVTTGPYDPRTVVVVERARRFLCP